MAENLPETEAEWKQRLTPEQFAVCRMKGTEPPFTGRFYHCTDTGIYKCVCCGNELFSSDAKYDSRSGWPSFWQPIHEQSVTTETDRSHGMVRTEVGCGKCGAHLGHVFEDGPQPTNLRYCINSVALDLAKKADAS